MNPPEQKTPFVAIACGGTGGHLFPGLAVAEELKKRGCTVALLISPKDVDQQAVKSALERRSPARHEPVGVQALAFADGTLKRGLQLAVPEAGAPMEVFTLPAVALQNKNYFSFAKSFWQSFRASREFFKQRKPDAVLAMGGFTSAPPILAARKFGAKTFLHESNTIPGRANRLLARFVDAAFVGFPEAAARLHAKKVSVTGTPVRPEFCASQNPVGRDSVKPKFRECRAALGLDPNHPVVLVMGGSQGASGLNEMILSALPLLKVGVQASACSNRDTLKRKLQPSADKPSALQFLHLTGATDFEKVKAAYASRGIKAVVKPFLAEMDMALGAATISVSRSGASSLAEIAAMRLPSLLVPYPAAADNHQFSNARAFEKTGAAKLLEQKNSTPEKVAALLLELIEDSSAREKIQAALVQWHAPKAAEQIAENILIKVGQASCLSSERFSASSSEQKLASALPTRAGKMPALL